MEYDWKKIGKRIGEERKKLGFNQEVFGEKIGVARPTVSKWERGTPCDLESLAKMCELFDCEMAYMLCEIDAKTREKTDICKVTGLSEKAVENLIRRKSFSFHDSAWARAIDFLDFCLSEEGDTGFLYRPYQHRENRAIYRKLLDILPVSYLVEEFEMKEQDTDNSICYLLASAFEFEPERLQSVREKAKEAGFDYSQHDIVGTPLATEQFSCFSDEIKEAVLFSMQYRDVLMDLKGEINLYYLMESYKEAVINYCKSDRGFHLLYKWEKKRFDGVGLHNKGV